MLVDRPAGALGPDLRTFIDSSAPWSCWSRHARDQHEYKPSRRMISARCDFESAASNSAKIFNLYAADTTGGPDELPGRGAGHDPNSSYGHSSLVARLLQLPYATGRQPPV
jgi:hypothetical protein